MTDTVKEPGAGGTLSYAQSRDLARAGDAGVRRSLAQRADVAPEILYYLAEDADAGVRRAVAVNQATPRQADLLLARDPDGNVRLALARKIGRLAPGLSPSHRDALSRLTLEALTTLARDALPRVRRAIAEEVKALDNVPEALVQGLARDVAVLVAAPVLEFSPLLSDSDLLEIIHSAPVRGALCAISRRHGLAALLCDAIADAGDDAAVAELLANPSAQIREETLDRLIDQAPAFPEWHRPLACRPKLSHEAAQRITRVVSRALLAELARAGGLAPTVATALQERVEARLDSAEACAGEGDAEAADPVPDLPARRQSVASAEAGEAAILDLIQRGRVGQLSEALAVRADLAPLAVRRIVRAGSAEAIVALAWKAGLSMACATALQTRIANIARGQVIAATAEDDYPLEADALARLLDSFLG
jgi:uncharacterized protein (DUF2336 family)